jgi:2-keto-4-pentenoate hydratase/2-oxohepta-3-ene-1,7-dioic acid hydratase in catechol pathway
MRIARFTYDDELRFGIVADDTTAAADPADLLITELDGHPFAPFDITNRQHRLGDVRLLSPTLPTKVVAIGRNYAEHARELGHEVPETPIVFLKPSTSVIGPGEPISYPDISHDVQHEAELAVVINRVCRQVPVERANDVILGYTCANDVTARDLQRSEPQWGRAKGFDTFCPLGPWIETDLDASDLAITCTVNGDLRQAGRTAQMLSTIADLIAHVTAAMTLLPGDVILTGTPAGVGPLTVGDRVEVTIEGIGTLSNPVLSRD